MGQAFASKNPANVICIGLDNSGKSTVINSLKPDAKKTAETLPTVGFQLEKFTHNQTNFSVWDMSGQGRYRNLWEHYYPHTHAIIFVIDSADPVRLCVVKDELKELLEHQSLVNNPIPILFFANKRDLPKAMKATGIADALELQLIIDRNWQIYETNAKDASTLKEGLKWLEDQLPKS